MAQESCNLDKDEAEILKPSSSSPPSPPSPSPPTPPTSSASSSTPPSLFLKPSQDFQAPKPDRSEIPAVDVAAVSCTLKPEEESQPPILFGNRCSNCRKKVGITGFRCRCGDLFCYRHRYSETHDCSFDYKAAGREEISKANPLIRAAKIIKI